MTVHEKLYTAEEFYTFVERPENLDHRWELIEGIIVEMPPSSPKNSKLAARFVRHLGNFVDEHDLGHVLGADGGYTLSPHNVRIPDVSFISKERAPSLPKHFDIAPELAVEVISPSESPRSVLDKIGLYLNSGVIIVWAVYPDDKVIEVWQASDNGKMTVQKLTLDDTLDGGEVLSGFTLAVKVVFAGID